MLKSMIGRSADAGAGTRPALVHAVFQPRRVALVDQPPTRHAHGRHQRARPYHHTVFVALGLAQLIWQAA